MSTDGGSWSPFGPSGGDDDEDDPPPASELNWPDPAPAPEPFMPPVAPPTPAPVPVPPPVSHWPGTPPQAYGTPTRLASNATASLVLGIVGLVMCPLIASVPAIILGRNAKREIRAHPHELSGESQATWGIALGWIGVVLSLLGILIFLLAAGAVVTTSP